MLGLQDQATACKRLPHSAFAPAVQQHVWEIPQAFALQNGELFRAARCSRRALRTEVAGVTQEVRISWRAEMGEIGAKLPDWGAARITAVPPLHCAVES